MLIDMGRTHRCRLCGILRERGHGLSFNRTSYDHESTGFEIPLAVGHDLIARL
jgi:hypothetical protein